MDEWVTHNKHGDTYFTCEMRDFRLEVYWTAASREDRPWRWRIWAKGAYGDINFEEPAWRESAGGADSPVFVQQGCLKAFQEILCNQSL